MIWCFDRPDYSRKPDLAFVSLSRFVDGTIPKGDVDVVPDLVAEVLSAGTSGAELSDRLDDYLEAGIALVWIVNSDRKTIRVYRNDSTTRLFHAADVIESEPSLPGFRLFGRRSVSERMIAGRRSTGM